MHHLYKSRADKTWHQQNYLNEFMVRNTAHPAKLGYTNLYRYSSSIGFIQIMSDVFMLQNVILALPWVLSFGLKYLTKRAAKLLSFNIEFGRWKIEVQPWMNLSGHNFPWMTVVVSCCGGPCCVYKGDCLPQNIWCDKALAFYQFKVDLTARVYEAIMACLEDLWHI